MSVSFVKVNSFISTFIFKQELFIKNCHLNKLKKKKKKIKITKTIKKWFQVNCLQSQKKQITKLLRQKSKPNKWKYNLVDEQIIYHCNRVEWSVFAQ